MSDAIFITNKTAGTLKIGDKREIDRAWFSPDTDADDWHRGISSKKIVTLAMNRLEARGRGVLLLHDIHRATADALPDLLKELTQKGFHVVHVVPSSVDQF